MSYSQYGEDVIIGDIFGGAKGSPGRFLDIGAWDPITFSNTRLLYERNWRGVLIEPAPGPMIEILRCCIQCSVGVDEREHEIYGERKTRACKKCGSIRYGFEPRLTIIQATMAIAPGFTRIAATDDALSTSDEASEKKWESVGGFYGYIMVPNVTWEQISNQFGGFDMCSIDAEGTSVDLFQRMLALGIFPKCVCLEYDNRLPEACSAATQKGYKLVHSNGTNAIFAQ